MPVPGPIAGKVVQGVSVPASVITLGDVIGRRGANSARAGVEGSLQKIGPVTVTTPAAIYGRINHAIQAVSVSVSGGTGSYLYQLYKGSFPSGVGINADTGEIAGTPTATTSTGNAIQIVVYDSRGGAAVTDAFVLEVADTFVVGTIDAQALTNGESFALNIGYTGGRFPVAWSVFASYVLPPGLSIDSETGTISGTPTTDGTYPVIITATDANGISVNTVEADFVVTT